MFKDKIKSIIEKNVKGDNKKTVENLVVFLVLLIITIISINLIWGKDTERKTKEPDEESSYVVLAQEINNSNNSEKDEYNLERKLEDTLSKISGVGKVQVLITYSETSEVVAMHNEEKNTSKTEENDSNRRNKNNRINR